MKKWITLAMAVSVAVLAAGCATSQPTARAVVCPDCQAQLTHPAGGLDLFAYAITDGQQRCPRCQGEVTTRLEQGQWQYHCSTCQQAPASQTANGS